MFCKIACSVRLFIFLLIFSCFSVTEATARKYIEITGKQNFLTEESSNDITISNGLIELKFFKEDGFGLYSIKNVKKNHDFLLGEAKGSTLWKIEFKQSSNRLVTIDNNVECAKTYDIEKSADGNNLTLNLYWKGITLGTEEKSVNVHAVVRLDKSPFSYWQINVENDSKQFGTWEVAYPSIKGLKASEDEDIQLAYPDFIGCLVKNPIKRIPEMADSDPKPPQVLNYPSARCNMQFSTLFEGRNNNGLYLATHDSQANVKKFGYDIDEKDRSLKYSIKNYPEGMGIPGSRSSYRMPYEAVIGVYEGDWITASKIYRKWAVNQEWCEKGKLAQRTDIPQWYLNTPVWLRAAFYSSQEGLHVDKITSLAKYLDVPTVFQWYGWYQFPKENVAEPDYFSHIPDKELFANETKELKGAGIKIVPYINSRYWATSSKSWINEHPEAAACKQPNVSFDNLISYSNWPKSAWRDLSIYMEHWYPEDDTLDTQEAVMCPTTGLWQNKEAEIVTRLVAEHGANGVYMDQIASCQPAYCFDPAHGHPIGGGHHWVDGYRKLVQLSKESARKNNPGIILTTEDFAEPYINVFDGLLACNASSIAPDLIPLFKNVYSGYCLTFGRRTRSSGLILKMANAQMFLWGEQLGWFVPNILNLDSPEAKYLKVLSKSLDKPTVKKFLFYGEMVRPLKLEGDDPVLGVAWEPRQKNSEMPAVSNSVWKADDGTVGLVFTNLDNSAHTISYHVDTRDYQLPQSKKYSVKVVDGAGAGKEKSYHTDSFSRTEKMPAGSVLVLEIRADRK